ncbi:unnamed protein product [Peniophora sp. CBMAI 1063]|nr:unnamed protein product [Peniophora sp. CBMAI 1063]
MTEALLDAPPDLTRALQGISILSPEQPTDGSGLNADREAHYRAYMAAAFIYACVDNDSGNWSNFHLSTTDEQSSFVSDASNAPRISVCDSDAGEEFLNEAVHAALPGLSDPCSRPSGQLSSNGDVWRCPVTRCKETLRPYNLTQQQRGVVAKLSGDDNTMIIEGDDGKLRLRHKDPWKFLRYIDAVAWEHISWHLHRAHITFYYPHPDRPYKECAGYWWNEALLARDQSLLQEVEGIEIASRQNRRQWLVTAAINSAQRKTQRACARLTRLRHNALQARRRLVSQMFSLNRGVVEVGRSLLTLVREQETDPLTAVYSAEIAHYRAVEMEWTEEQHIWF